MKKKIIPIIILMFFLFSTIIQSNCVIAAFFKDQIDKDDKIKFSNTMNTKDNKLIGTITLKDDFANYKLSYQVVMINKNQYNTLNNKKEEINSYIRSYNEIVKERKEKLKKLKEKLETIRNNSKISNTEKNKATKDYNNKVLELKEFANSEKEKIQTMKSEYYKSIPNYTTSWTSATNKTDNVNIATNNYSGEIYYVLWAKAENGTDTYYDCKLYSNTVENNNKDNNKNGNSNIKFSDIMNLKDNKLTGSITLTEDLTNYKLSYQVVMINKNKYTSLNNKKEEINSYIRNYNEIVKERKEKLKKLREELETIRNNSNISNTEKNKATKDYNNKVLELKEFANSEKEKIQTMKSEYYKSIPNYTTSWTSATNKTDNVNIATNNYSGEIYYVLWAKADNGTNTYYNCKLYSNIIENNSKEKEDNNKDNNKENNNNKDTNNKSKNEDNNKESKNTDTDNKNTNTNSDSDSNNKKDSLVMNVELKKSGASLAVIELKGNALKQNSIYYYFIGNSSNELDTKNIDKSKLKGFKITESTNKYILNDEIIGDSVERNKDIYFSIFEEKDNKLNSLIVNKKLTKYKENKFADAFSGTLIRGNHNLINTTFTHNSKNKRKMEVKIGKITNKNILQKIKNGEQSGFEELMAYSKSASTIYDNVMICDENKSIQYDTTKESELIKLTNLENGAYYFLYVKTDDENGKYASNEAITLAQAKSNTDKDSFMTLYGTDDFKWEELDSNNSNKTTNTQDKTATNTQDKTTNNTQNKTTNTQDKTATTNTQDKATTNTQNKTTTNTHDKIMTNAQNKTTAKTVLPHTGKSVLTIGVIIGFFAGAGAFVFYKKMRKL